MSGYVSSSHGSPLACAVCDELADKLVSRNTVRDCALCAVAVLSNIMHVVSAKLAAVLIEDLATVSLHMKVISKTG